MRVFPRRGELWNDKLRFWRNHLVHKIVKTFTIKLSSSDELSVIYLVFVHLREIHFLPEEPPQEGTRNAKWREIADALKWIDILSEMSNSLSTISYFSIMLFVDEIWLREFARWKAKAFRISRNKKFAFTRSFLNYKLSSLSKLIPREETKPAVYSFFEHKVTRKMN